MIHTFELQKQITPEEVKSIIDRCSFHTSYSAKNNTTLYSTKELRDKGINEVTIMKLPLKAAIGYEFYIRLVVNPSVITPPVNTQVEKEDARNYPTGINAFSELYIFSLYDYLYSIFPELNAHSRKNALADICKVEDIRCKEALYKEWHEDNYHSFMLNRIDYTFDINHAHRGFGCRDSVVLADSLISAGQSTLSQQVGQAVGVAASLLGKFYSLMKDMAFAISAAEIPLVENQINHLLPATLGWQEVFKFSGNNLCLCRSHPRTERTGSFFLLEVGRMNGVVGGFHRLWLISLAYHCQFGNAEGLRPLRRDIYLLK